MMLENNAKSPLTMSKLVYSSLVVSGVAYLNNGYLPRSLMTGGDITHAIGRAAIWAYTIEALLTFLATTLVVLAYAHFRLLFTLRSKTKPLWATIGIGFIMGLVGSYFAGLAHNSDAFQQGVVLSKALVFNDGPALGIVALFVIAVALPIVGELFYRAIVFRTLTEYASLPAAVLGSSILFSFCFLPLYNPLTRVIFGVLAAGIFYWTGTIIAPMVASISFSCSLFISVLIRALISKG